MSTSKLMKERVRRVRVLFKELGYKLFDGELDNGSYSAAFTDRKGFQSGFYIDNECTFLELSFSFMFSNKLAKYVQNKLEEILLLCYEFGCYVNIQNDEDEIIFSVFSKIYYSGLTYEALKETLIDFRLCVEAIKEVFQLNGEDDEST